MSYALQNPIHQNYGHIKAFEATLGQTTPGRFISLIAFSGNTKTKISGQQEGVHVVRISQVATVIESYKNEVMSADQRDRIYNTLKELQVSGKVLKEEHLTYVKGR